MESLRQTKIYISAKSGKHFTAATPMMYITLSSHGLLISFKEGCATASFCVAPAVNNGLHDKMKSDFLSDLKEKYNISISDYNMRYAQDELME